MSTKMGACRSLNSVAPCTLSQPDGEDPCARANDLAPAPCRANPVRILPLGGVNFSVNS